MKFIYIKNATIALIMTISSFVGVANATLITDLTERDWMVPGDKALTYDRSTGLEWLDITETLGNSILETEAESFFGDFRWATNVDIENLFDSVIVGSGLRGNNDSAAHDAALRFHELFGEWDTTTSIQTQALSRGSVSTTGGYGLGFVRSDAAGNATVGDPLHNCCWNEAQSSIAIGAWLVRMSNTPTILPVPEPSTIAIFALGMFGLASRRFKMQS